MKDSLYKLLENSNLTLIGYTYKNEKFKDTFISKFNPVIINEIDESFSLQSYLRGFRIDSILTNEFSNSKYIVIDLTDVRISKSFGDLNRPKFFRKIAEDLRVCSSTMGIKPILTSAMYRTIDGGKDGVSFKGGVGPVYVSDLVMTFGDDSLKIVKSRRYENFNISYDELKENSYI